RGNENVPDYKNHQFAKDGFNYRVAYFEDADGQYYRATISVGKNGEINTIYNVGKMKKIQSSHWGLMALVAMLPRTLYLQILYPNRMVM
ncbi:MAG: hypothetical protein RR389_08380, partial [Christensenella sp.]